MLTCERAKVTFEGVTFSGCVRWNEKTPEGTGRVLVFRQGPNWVDPKTGKATIKPPPVGSMTFNDVSLMDAAYGVVCDPGNHCDHFRGLLTVDRVKYPYVLNENQAVDHDIDLNLKGRGEYAVWVKDGGRSEFRIATTQPWVSWLAVGDSDQKTAPTKNNGKITVDVWADNLDHVQHPLAQLYAHEYALPRIDIRAFAADDVSIGPPIIQRGRISIVVERAQKPEYRFEYDTIREVGQ